MKSYITEALCVDYYNSTSNATTKTLVQSHHLLEENGV